jgi:hypothetical protein
MEKKTSEKRKKMLKKTEGNIFENPNLMKIMVRKNGKNNRN